LFPLHTKKAVTADMADSPGGSKFSLYGAISPIINIISRKPAPLVAATGAAQGGGDASIAKA
jgi:hypothetical protein